MTAHMRALCFRIMDAFTQQCFCSVFCIRICKPIPGEKVQNMEEVHNFHSVGSIAGFSLHIMILNTDLNTAM